MHRRDLLGPVAQQGGGPQVVGQVVPPRDERVGEAAVEDHPPSLPADRRVGAMSANREQPWSDDAPEQGQVVVVTDNPIGRAVVAIAQIAGRRTVLLPDEDVDRSPAQWLAEHPLERGRRVRDVRPRHPGHGGAAAARRSPAGGVRRDDGQPAPGREGVRRAGGRAGRRRRWPGCTSRRGWTPAARHPARSRCRWSPEVVRGLPRSLRRPDEVALDPGVGPSPGPGRRSARTAGRWLPSRSGRSGPSRGRAARRPG